MRQTCEEALGHAIYNRSTVLVKLGAGAADGACTYPDEADACGDFFFGDVLG